MSTTIKITDLTELTTPDSNTLNTVFVVVDKSSGSFTTKQLSLANLDFAIDNVAPVAFATANLAYGQANSANILAQSAFNAANTSQADATGAFALANTANTTADASFDAANTAQADATGAFALANTANTTAEASYAFANTINVTAEASYAWANTINISVDSAYAFANTINIKTDSAYAFANTVNITADAAFTQANAANVLAQAAFDAANTANAGVVQGAFDTANAAFNQANSANIIAQSAYDFANSVNTVLYTTITDEQAAFAQANAANVLAQAAFDAANTPQAIANTANITAEAAFAQANTANVTAEAAFAQANSANIIAQAAFDGANTAQADATGAFALANSANVLAQNAYDFANTVSVLGNDFIQNAANTANAANVTADAAFDRANTAITSSALSFNAANTAQVDASAAFNKANVVDIFAQSAYNQANTNNALAQAAFNTANTANVTAEAAYAQANTIQPAFTQANTANITADAAFSQANLSFAQANAANVLAQAAFNAANTAQADATGAFALSNTTSTVTQAAYDTANTALATAAIAINYDNFANAAFDKANSANIFAQSVYDWSNTVHVHAEAAYTLANTNSNRINDAFIESGAAFTQANSANVLAQAAFDAANSATLNLTSVSSNIIPSADDTYDLGSSSNQWKSLYVSNNTIFIGGTPVSVNNGQLVVGSGEEAANLATVSYVDAAVANAGGGTSNTGNITFSNTTISSPDGSDLILDATNAEVSITGTDFRVETTDDVRITGADIFRLVNESADESIEITTNNNATARNWDFGVDGNLQLPVDGDIIFRVSDGEVGRIIPGVSDGDGLTVQAKTDLEINVIDGEGGEAIWSFETDGRLYFPDDTFQTTAYTGASPFDQDLNTSNNVSFVELAADAVNTTNLEVSATASLAKVVEPFSSIANANSVVVHDCSSGQIFNHTSIDDNFTANFTNLNLENGKATSITLVLNQGATAYVANVVQIESACTTIRWSGNTIPTGNVNSIDVQSFSILNVGGTYTVLGQLNTFG